MLAVVGLLQIDQSHDLHDICFSMKEGRGKGENPLLLPVL